MEWTRSETLALAAAHCSTCRGLGLVNGRKGSLNPCNCVLRAIFRACLSRFRHCTEKEKHVGRIHLEAIPGGRDRKVAWGRKDEEFIADFCLVSKRSLSEQEHRIFRYHFLLGADWKLCCRKLKMDRGNFFHAVYRIQQRLGRVFRELQPYALYPLSEYFHGTPVPVTAFPARTATVIPIRPPVRTVESGVPDGPIQKIA